MVMRIILGLLFLVVLCSPSSAVIRQLNAHPGADELQAACGGGEFSWSDDGDGYTCIKKNCDGKGGTCTVSCDQSANCQGSTPSKVGPGVGFAFGDIDSLVFQIAPVKERRLAASCTLLGHGIFGTSKDGNYFCVNPECDKSGQKPCYVECRAGICTAGMPDKPTAGLTILAILQNGDPVNHLTPPAEPNSTKHGDAPAASTGGAATPPPPPPPPVIQ